MHARAVALNLQFEIFEYSFVLMVSRNLFKFPKDWLPDKAMQLILLDRSPVLASGMHRMVNVGAT